MKLTQVLDITAVNELSSEQRNQLPHHVIAKISGISPGSREGLFVVVSKGFTPTLMKRDEIRRFYPSALPRPFSQALEILRDNKDLVMCRYGYEISWNKVSGTFKDQKGKDWVPTPDIILSGTAEWFVKHRDESVN